MSILEKLLVGLGAAALVGAVAACALVVMIAYG
jgi:hypothetical protein